MKSDRETVNPKVPCSSSEIKGYGEPRACSLASCNSQGLCFEFYSLNTKFLGQLSTSWLLSFSGIMTAPSCSFHNLTPKSLMDTAPGLTDFPLKSGWNHPWPHNLCILHVNKICIIWERFPLGAEPILLEHGCHDFWVTV